MDAPHFILFFLKKEKKKRKKKEKRKEKENGQKEKIIHVYNGRLNRMNFKKNSFYNFNGKFNSFQCNRNV